MGPGHFFSKCSIWRHLSLRPHSENAFFIKLCDGHSALTTTTKTLFIQIKFRQKKTSDVRDLSIRRQTTSNWNIPTVRDSIWGQFHQLNYVKLLCVQILKAQKAAWIDCLFALFGYVRIKAARKMLVKLTPGGNETVLKPSSVTHKDKRTFHFFDILSLWS